MDEEQAVFEQLTLGKFKICNSSALNSFNIYRKIMTNITNNTKIS